MAALSHNEAVRRGCLGGLATVKKYGKPYMRLIAKNGGQVYVQRYVAESENGKFYLANKAKQLPLIED